MTWPEEFADRYDEWTAGVTADIAFYVELAGEANGPIVELAVGSGRVAVPIAVATGRPVIGVDTSPAMLEAARRRADEAGVELVLRLGDMADLELDEPAALVICPFRALLHVPTWAVRRRLFERVAASLCPGGRFAVERLRVRPPASRPVSMAFVSWTARLPTPTISPSATIGSTSSWTRERRVRCGGRRRTNGLASSTLLASKLRRCTATSIEPCSTSTATSTSSSRVARRDHLSNSQGSVDEFVAALKATIQHHDNDTHFLTVVPSCMAGQGGVILAAGGV